MSNKKNDDFHMSGPPPKTTFKQFLYNPDTKQVLGRTLQSWFLILVFYIVLYAFLAGFFSTLLFVFYKTLEDGRPKWTQHESLIGNNPGVGYRPMHKQDDVLLIEFDPNNQVDVNMWRDQVNDFLKPYQVQNETVPCSYTDKPDANKACQFRIPALTNCTVANSYGFASGQPCIFLKMNKIYGWEPKPYTYHEVETNTTTEGVAINMPEHLRRKVLDIGLVDGEINLARQQIVENNVWVSCTSDNGTIFEYDAFSAKKDEPGSAGRYPIMGMPSFYYPYMQQKQYLSPFVVVQLFDLPKDHIVKVTCQLWAKGITIDRQRRLGLTHIEIKRSK